MAEDFRIDETLRRAMDANLRYYQALGRITADYLQALGGIWNNALPLDLGTLRIPGTRAEARGTQSPVAPEPATTPALVLEADAGQEARGIFMVDNSLGRPVSTTVTVTAFRSDDGAEATPSLRVEPAVVALESGTSTLVQLIATVPESAEVGVSYRAEVDVPGLAERAIPVVLRRSAAAEAPGREADADRPRRPGRTPPERAGPAAERTSAGRKRGAAEAAAERSGSEQPVARPAAAKKAQGPKRAGGNKGSGTSGRGRGGTRGR